MVTDNNARRIIPLDRPEWLARLQSDLTLITAEESRKFWPGPSELDGPYCSFRVEHVQQVERNALRLLEEIPVDYEIVLAAVWIHDRFQPQYAGDQHAARAADWAGKHLAQLGFPAEKVAMVVEAVARHTDPPGTIPEQAVEARLLWDADKLTRIGTLNVVMYMLAHPAFTDQRISFTNMALHGLERLECSRRLVEALYFDCSRQIALERYKQQKAFFEAVAQDVEV